MVAFCKNAIIITRYARLYSCNGYTKAAISELFVNVLLSIRQSPKTATALQGILSYDRLSGSMAIQSWSLSFAFSGAILELN